MTHKNMVLLQILLLGAGETAAHAASSASRSNEPCPEAQTQAAPAVPAGVRDSGLAVSGPKSDRSPRKCDPADRNYTGDMISCCTTSMLRQVDGVREEALKIVTRVRDELHQGTKFRRAFRNHFSGRDDDTVRTVGERVDAVWHTLQKQNTGNIAYMCRDSRDAFCGKQLGSTGTCADVPQWILLCGDYAGATFFGGPRNMRTLIHEYMHASCLTPLVNEIYEGDLMSYPPPKATALKNADSYTAFILEAFDGL